MMQCNTTVKILNIERQLEVAVNEIPRDSLRARLPYLKSRVQRVVDLIDELEQACEEKRASSEGRDLVSAWG